MISKCCGKEFGLHITNNNFCMCSKCKQQCEIDLRHKWSELSNDQKYFNRNLCRVLEVPLDLMFRMD